MQKRTTSMHKSFLCARRCSNIISLLFESESLMHWFTFYLCLIYPHLFPNFLPLLYTDVYMFISALLI